ncbi:TPA: PAAR domain-containing protein [Vibrio parahaemolyticus]|nr:PAAR domain-containing protein [Vibrio parahaemolyticus]HCZ9712157.1 PAAR domain-containing protein [Vibrio parahaemolyticus]
MAKLITLGTLTSTGGKIITASSNMTINGKKVVKLGDIGTCPCGKKSCRGQGKIYRKGVRKITIDGTELAKGGDPIDTGCGTCFVSDPVDMVCIGELNSQGIIIGGNGTNIQLGDNISLQGADSISTQKSSVTSQVSPTHKPRNTDIESLVTDNIKKLSKIADEVKSEFITCDPQEFFYSKILAHEGGFVDNPNDRGGATNKGVTIDTWRRFSDKLFNIAPSVDSLKAMTDEQAYEIFVEGYWNKSLANKIRNCPIAFQFVDFYYNAPQGSAVVLQRTINELGGNVVEDWHMGPSSLKAVNELIDSGKEKEIYLTFRRLRIEYYNHRADTVEGQSVFRNGWIARAESFKDY